MHSTSQRCDRTALVLYGSETGNAQEIAEDMGRLAERLRFSTRVAELDEVGVKELLQPDVVLFAVATTGQGEFPGNARQLWRKLRNARLQPGALASLSFTSFGLGDSSYPQYNWAHRKLYNRLRHLGADPFYERGESDEQHPEGVEGCYLPWSVKLRASLLEQCPLPDGLEPLPEDEFLTPKWELRFEEPPAALKGTSSPASHLPNGGAHHQHQAAGSVTAEASMSGRQKLRCTLVKNERLTPTDHWQDVRVFEFRCDPVQYSPGDVLTIFPKNTEQDVEAILSVMDWTAEADKPIHFEPTSPPYDGKWYPPPPLPLKRGATLRDLLRNHLDINSIPRRSFFTQVAHFTQDEMQKERLVDFTMPEYVDELYDYTSRPRRSIIEVLQEFDTVRIPLKWAASVFPLIRGRQFSIASGGELKVNEDGSGRIQLLVAIVKYKTVIKKLREGLCTKYLADLEPGAQMETVLCKGGMRYDPSKPAVMIGPGTGVAPIRSMMHERASLDQPASQNQSLPNILFYGGRNRTADFFFEDEWKRLQSEAALEVHTAFSRDQRSKVYVQDIIRQQANAVFNILRSGYVHICGSSGKMPQAVREALTEVIQEQGAMERSDAEAFLLSMEKSGRYQQETW